MSDFRKLIDLTNLYTRYTLLEATAEELAQTLYDAGSGKVFGTDEKAIMKALAQIKSPEEFKSVSDAYKAMSPRQRDLTKDLQDEMSGNELERLNNTLAKFNPAASGTVQQEPATEPAATATPSRGRNPNSRPAAPEVDSTAPAQPTTPTANNAAPKIPGAETPGMPIDGDQSPAAPEPAAPDTISAAPEPAAEPETPTANNTAPAAEPETPTAEPETPAAPTVAPGTGADGPAGGAKAPAAPAAPEAPETPAAVKPPVRPEQQTSGLPAKLAQIKSANLMKDYQAGGKKPMDQVKTVQTALSRAGFDPGKIDGMYGNGVFKAVQDFQKANGLQVDGQVGPATIKALIAKSGGGKGIVGTFTNKLVSGGGGIQNADDPEAQVFAGGAAPTQQNASKDHSMKKAMNESASMNVSMTADTADQVAELMKLLKNAGMSDAAPVSSMMAPMPSMPPMGAAAPKQDSMADFIGMVGGDEMDGPSEPCSVCGEVHEETSCSEDTSEYDAVVAEWDNSPDEEYKDANYMLNDLAGGLNRPKKAYAAAQDGDNAMAVEAIKADLRKALEEALAKK